MLTTVTALKRAGKCVCVCVGGGGGGGVKNTYSARRIQGDHVAQRISKLQTAHTVVIY